MWNHLPRCIAESSGDILSLTKCGEVVEFNVLETSIPGFPSSCVNLFENLNLRYLHLCWSLYFLAQPTYNLIIKIINQSILFIQRIVWISIGGGVDPNQNNSCETLVLPPGAILNSPGRFATGISLPSTFRLMVQLPRCSSCRWDI